MTIAKPILTAALALACAVPGAWAQDVDLDNIQQELSQARSGLSGSTAADRALTLEGARQGASAADAEIRRREERLREDYGQMSDAARDAAQESFIELRAARDDLYDSLDALEAGPDDDWEDLTSDTADAFGDMSDAFDAEDAGGFGVDTTDSFGN